MLNIFFVFVIDKEPSLIFESRSTKWTKILMFVLNKSYLPSLIFVSEGTYYSDQKTKAFVFGKPFMPSLLFEGKAVLPHLPCQV